VKLSITLLATMAMSSSAVWAQESDIDKLRQELLALKNQYLEKIQALEQRLQDAEQQVEETQADTQDLSIELSQQANRTAPNTFNPGIGVVLNGQYLQQSRSDYEFSLPGFIPADESGPGDQGLSLGESEINLVANVDDKLMASVTLAFGEETEVEEAYLQTLGLADGFRIKFGRFFSGIGYLNSRHAHTDDFAMRPLAYQAFLGSNYRDDGVQLTWLAPTDLFWESGIELYRGDSFPAGGAANKGIGVKTLFSHLGGDIGFSQSWRAGISYMMADGVERSIDNEQQDSFSGESRLWLADFIWKWAPDGNSNERNAKFQAEYFQRKEQGAFSNLAIAEQELEATQSGWYAQAVYQFMPQWRVGMRYEALQSDELSAVFADSVFDNLGYKPKQLSFMVDWSNSEFSRLRLQFSQDKGSPESTDLLLLQYIAAFGAHGAHSF
jgi:hypothetical protein